MVVLSFMSRWFLVIVSWFGDSLLVPRTSTPALGDTSGPVKGQPIKCLNRELGDMLPDRVIFSDTPALAL
jgi:hypothetical protein